MALYSISTRRNRRTRRRDVIGKVRKKDNKKDDNLITRYSIIRGEGLKRLVWELESVASIYSRKKSEKNKILKKRKTE